MDWVCLALRRLRAWFSWRSTTNAITLIATPSNIRSARPITLAFLISMAFFALAFVSNPLNFPSRLWLLYSINQSRVDKMGYLPTDEGRRTNGSSVVFRQRL